MWKALSALYHSFGLTTLWEASHKTLTTPSPLEGPWLEEWGHCDNSQDQLKVYTSESPWKQFPIVGQGSACFHFQIVQGLSFRSLAEGTHQDGNQGKQDTPHRGRLLVYKKAARHGAEINHRLRECVLAPKAAGVLRDTTKGSSHREIAPQGSMYRAGREELSSVPSTHVRRLMVTCNPATENLMSCFDFHGHTSKY